MKRMFLLIILTCLLFAYGCSNNVPETVSEQQTNGIIHGVDTIEEILDYIPEETMEVDKSPLNVEITIQPSMIADESPEGIEAAAKDRGVDNFSINPNGSVTYIMSKEEHKVFLEKGKKELLANIDSIVSNNMSVINIKYNSDFTEYTIVVDRPTYEDGYNITVSFALGFDGMLYQMMAGVSPENSHVVINEKDVVTGEIFNTKSFPDVIEAVGQ